MAVPPLHGDRMDVSRGLRSSRILASSKKGREELHGLVHIGAFACSPNSQPDGSSRRQHHPLLRESNPEFSPRLLCLPPAVSAVENRRTSIAKSLDRLSAA